MTDREKQRVDYATDALDTLTTQYRGNDLFDAADEIREIWIGFNVLKTRVEELEQRNEALISMLVELRQK